MNDSYSPVAYEYREVIHEQLEKRAKGKVFFFDDQGHVDSAEGTLTNVEEIPGKGIFITLDEISVIRIDKIITLFGKPGAAYDVYEAYGNVCLDCTGGYPV